MVTEEVRTAKMLQSSRGGKPVIIPIRINCPFSLLNHDLRAYLMVLFMHMPLQAHLFLWSLWSPSRVMACHTVKLNSMWKKVHYCTTNQESACIAKTRQE